MSGRWSVVGSSFMFRRIGSEPEPITGLFQPHMFVKWPRTVRKHVRKHVREQACSCCSQKSHIHIPVAVSVREHDVCEIKKNMPITCLCFYQYANNLFVLFL